MSDHVPLGHTVTPDSDNRLQTKSHDINCEMYIIHLKSNFAYLTHGEFVVTVYNFSNLHCKRYDDKTFV